jgi:hypothetical protein
LFAVPVWIEYGANPGAVAANAARVEFTTGPRCLPNEEPCFGPENTYKWYDTPWDLNCALFLTSCPGNTAPTFWSSARLVSITTKVRDGAAWVGVDRYDLGHNFPGTWDTSSMSWRERQQRETAVEQVPDHLDRHQQRRPDQRGLRPGGRL